MQRAKPAGVLSCRAGTCCRSDRHGPQSLLAVKLGGCFEGNSLDGGGAPRARILLRPEGPPAGRN